MGKGVETVDWEIYSLIMVQDTDRREELKEKEGDTKMYIL